jgi:HNH endonuclease
VHQLCENVLSSSELLSETQALFMTSPALDAIAPRSEQREWLDGRLSNSSPSDRTIREDSIENQARALRIASAPYWPQTRSFLRQYILQCVFLYAKTELNWWSITVGPVGGSIRVNIGPQETLTINPWEAFHAHILVDSTNIPENDRPDIELTLSTSIKRSPYTIVDNQLWVESNEIQFLSEFLRLPTLVEAARVLNIRLMRARRNVWARWHSFDIVAAIFAQADDLTSDLTTEIERITGVRVPELLEACHIKPWRDCLDDERLNIDNGICLAAHIHKCFDSNLIGIRPDGKVEYSGALGVDDRRRLGLGDSQISINEGQLPFIELRYQTFLRETERSDRRAIDAV